MLVGWESKEDVEKEIKNVKRDISRIGRDLISKAKKNGGIWENFGQKECRKLEDKYGRYMCDYNYKEVWNEIRNFENWIKNLTSEDIRDL